MKHVTPRQVQSLLAALDRRERELRARIADERTRTDTEDHSQLEGIVADEADRAFVETSVDIETGRVEHQLKELAVRADSASAWTVAGRSSTRDGASMRPRCAARSARRCTRIRGPVPRQ